MLPLHSPHPQLKAGWQPPAGWADWLLSRWPSAAPAAASSPAASEWCAAAWRPATGNNTGQEGGVVSSGCGEHRQGKCWCPAGTTSKHDICDGSHRKPSPPSHPPRAPMPTPSPAARCGRAQRWPAPWRWQHHSEPHPAGLPGQRRAPVGWQARWPPAATGSAPPAGCASGGSAT